MFSLLRVLFSIAYLGGTFIHLYNGARQPQVYGAFGDTAVAPGFGRVWSGVIMPAIRPLAFVLAGVELFMARAMLAGGGLGRAGVALSIGFNLFLVQLGLAMPKADRGQDFLVNRLPNLLLAVVQLPLLGMDLKALGCCREKR